MTDELGLDVLRAHALNNIGVAKANIGDLSGVEDLRRSIDIASELNSPESRRGLNNLGSLIFYLGDLPSAEGLHREALAVSERFGIAGDVFWGRSELASDAYYAGRWDEVASTVDELIAESGGRNPPLHGGELPLCSGSDSARARGCRRRRPRRLGSPRACRRDQGPTGALLGRAGAARVFLAGDRSADASAQVDTLLADVGAEGVQQLASSWALDLAVVMAALGRGRELLEHAPELGASTPWLEAAMLWAEGEPERAADLLGEMRSLPDEALARLRAADKLVTAGRRAEADEQLDRALAFFRAVGATHYIREAEELLAAAS